MDEPIATTTPNENDIALFGLTNYRNSLRPFGIKKDDRRRHMYVVGKTGMGKSTLLENMIVQDIRAGRGLAVVDPHGDLVEKIVKYIPSQRINDVIYFNPSDSDYPIAFNILESVDETHRHLVASGLIAVFKKIWIDSWGPRLEYILRNTILALLEYDGSTLLGVTRIYVDKAYRKKVVERVQDPIIKAFWTTEYETYANQFRTEAVSPIQNKIGQFLSSPIIRNIVGQSKSTIDMRAIMDGGKILLMNLAKGRIGEDNAALLGAMMITKIQLAAMSRIDIPEEERNDFFLYVDEFQNFATESFANILSEARKYRLDLTIAHQYIEQLDEQVQAAVFGNVGTIVCFRVGAADAEFLAKEFEPVFTETDLVNLTKYDTYLKLMIDGVASEPFSATGMPPVQNPEGLEEKIIRVSRERYAKPKAVVEEKISRWAGFIAEAEKKDSEERRQSADTGPRRAAPEEKKDDFLVLDRAPVQKETIPEPISLTQALQPLPARPKRDMPRHQPRPEHRQEQHFRHPQKPPKQPQTPPVKTPSPTPPSAPATPPNQKKPVSAEQSKPLAPGEVVRW